MRIADAKLIQQTGYGCSEGGRRRFDFRRQRRGVSESRQVNRDDLELLRERRHDRIPRSP